MKKIFTLFALAATAMAMQAAAPELLFRGNAVENGGSYTTGWVKEDLGGFYQYLQDSELSVRGDKSKSVTVSVINKSETQGVQFCGVDGSCVQVSAPFWSTSKAAVLEAWPQAVIDGALATGPLQLDKGTYAFDDQVPAMTDIQVEVTTYYTDTPADAVTCTVTITNRPASEFGGVESVVADDASVVYCRGNIFNYSVPRVSKLNIFSANGALVLSQLVYNEGSVSLDSLHPGVYIYNLGSKSGKIIIRK